MTEHNDTTEEAAGEWIVIAQEPDQISAEIVEQLLHVAAIPARIAPADTMSFLGPSMLVTRVLVPKRWGREARAILARRGETDFSSSPGAL